MTIFDTETDHYLERVGAVHARDDWGDVLRRARHRERAARRLRLGAGGAAAVAATAIAIAIVGSVGGDSLLDKAEAAVVTPVRAAHGTIEHVLIEYRAEGGDPFIEYETWIAADGAWCRRTVEGVPGRRVADTRLTLCRSSTGVVEVYFPAGNEILRTRPGAGSSAPSGTAEKGWLTDDVIEQFRRDAVREEGTMTLDGHDYVKLVTADGHDTVLVDPGTGEAVAWIPSPAAFGVPTTVVKTRQTLPDDARSRRNLSLTELHPDAVVRDVTAAERERAIARQYPRG